MLEGTLKKSEEIKIESLITINGLMTIENLSWRIGSGKILVKLIWTEGFMSLERDW